MHEVLTETELNNKHTEIELNDPPKMDLENVNESQVAIMTIFSGILLES
jgi:hypothetical protein